MEFNKLIISFEEVRKAGKAFEKSIMDLVTVLKG